MSVLYIRDAATPVGWSNVTAWVANTVTAAGVLRRQSATPTVGNERVFISIVAGTTHATTEPTWTVTKGAKTTDNTVTWQECTGQPGVNGDITNTPLSSSVRSTSPGLGKVIKNNAGTHLFICSTNGACGAGEPSYVTTAVGNTTTDNACTWTYIGTSFSSWAAPHARLANAHASGWGAAGDTFYLGDDHAETQASAISWTPAGSLTAPTFNHSIDHTASLPPGGGNVQAGASISTTGNNALTFGTSGVSYFEGITFNAGSGAVTAAITIAAFSAGAFFYLKNCSLRKLGTSASAAAISLTSASGATVILDNTTVQFGATGDSINLGAGRVIWKNTSNAILGATLPTTLMIQSSQTGGQKDIVGIDLSALGSGKTLVSASNSHTAAITFVDCKLGSSVTVTSNPAAMGSRVSVIRSDSAATIYRQELYSYTGTLTQETTIVRTGGASDGTTTLAWKIVTTANSKWGLPFECFPISIWNATTGSSVTLTVYGIWGGGAVPNNDDIWIDVEYLGDASYPIASVATSTKTNGLATASALSSDSSTWGGSTTKFKMVATFTPQMAGYLRVYVRAAAASSTFYIDPRPVLS